MEMEVSNLLLTKDGKIIEKLLKSYSTSQTNRQELIQELIDPGLDDDGNKKNVFDIDIDLTDDESINKKILKKYLNFLELELLD